MRTISAALSTASLTGTGLAQASAVLTPFRFPTRMNDVGSVNICNQADMSTTHIIRVRFSTTNVQVNRLDRSSGLTIAANWNSWTTIKTEATNITQVAVFCTGARVTVLWMKTGNTNVFQAVSTDNGATFGATTTVITTADTVTNLRGMPQFGFLHYNSTTSEGFIYAYNGAGSYQTNEIPFPAGDIDGFEGSGRTFTDSGGTERSVITIIALIAVEAAVFHNQLWISSAADYLTATPTWTSAIHLETASELQGVDAISGVFEDYVMISYAQSEILCKLCGNTGVTYGYRYKTTVSNGIPCGYNSAEDALVFDQGSYAVIPAPFIEYDVIQYTTAKDSITCLLSGEEQPEFGTLFVERGYNNEVESLPPFIVRDWKEERSGFYTVTAVSGLKAIAGVPCPPGLYVNDTIGNAIKNIFGVVGLLVTINSETLLTSVQPFPNSTPVNGSLSGALSAMNHSGAIEIFMTEFGLRAIATKDSTPTQTITPDRESLITRSFRSYRGIFPFTGNTYTADPFDVEAMPFIPQMSSYPYDPTSYDAAVSDMNRENETIVTFITRTNLSIEENDVIINPAQPDYNWRIIAINESYLPRTGRFDQVVTTRQVL